MLWIILCGFLSKTLRAQSYNECHPTFYNNPQCVDRPAGYYCNCGPGFRWNSRQCIAAGVDSKMVFQSINTSYSILNRKSLPKEFLFSFWVRPRTSGILVSLVNDNFPNENKSQITIGINENFLYITYLTIEWKISKPLFYNEWNHIIWSQSNLDDKAIKWEAYINGSYNNKTFYRSPKIVKGEIILGQLSKNFKTSYEKGFGFSGDIAHFNVWNYKMNEKEIKAIHEDCSYNFCGNVVQWTDFRFGTRGNLLLKWPSGLPGSKSCMETNRLIQSCDSFCSRHIGAQCKVEIRANVEWERTKANTTVSNPCPMPPQLITPNVNSSLLTDVRPSISRFCKETLSKEGKWEDPDISACISKEWKLLQLKKDELQDLVGQCLLNDSDLIEGLNFFVNLTSKLILINAIDLSLCVDILDVLTELKEKQESKCPRFMIEISQNEKKFILINIQ